MEKAREDLRIIRTRKAIRDAFSELACEMDLSKITVTQLAERAGINRKTFYLHFESLETLFDCVMNEIMDEFFEKVETTPEVPEDIDGHARRFFLYLANQQKAVEKLICSSNYYDFGKRIYKTQMMRYRTAGDPFAWLPEDKEELVLCFLRNTALDFYRQWVADGKTVPQDEAAILLSELTCNGISRLMK